MGIHLTAHVKRVTVISCLAASSALLTACADSPPSMPVLASPDETRDGPGVRSVQGGFAVYVEKVDAPNSDIAPLAQYGLPLKVVVANLGDTLVDFGPEHVVIKKDGQPLTILTAQKIKDIKDQEQADSDDTDDFLSGLAMVAGAMAPVAAQQGQISAGQAALYGVESKMDVARTQLDRAETDARASTEKDALVRANQGIILPDGPIPAHGFTGGIVLVSGADPSDPLEVDVTTGGTKHIFEFNAVAQSE